MRNTEIKNLLYELKLTLKANVWSPGFITEVDSDPRYRALDLIEENTDATIEWVWKDTDFSCINGEPVVVEFSSTEDDVIKQEEGLKIIKKACGEKFHIIEGYNLIVILNKEGKNK